jgi:hypothetical protein
MSLVNRLASEVNLFNILTIVLMQRDKGLYL